MDKQDKKVIEVDVLIPIDGNVRMKEHEKLEKYQALKEEQERMWGGKASVVFVVIGALGAVTPKLIRGITPEASVQKCTAIETAKILRRTLRLPGLF